MSGLWHLYSWINQPNSWDLWRSFGSVSCTFFPIVMTQLEGAHTFCEYFSQRVSGFTFFTSFFSSRHCNLIAMRFIDTQMIFLVKSNIYHDSLPSSPASQRISVDCEQSLEGRHCLCLLEKKKSSQKCRKLSQNNTENSELRIWISFYPWLFHFLINCNSVCCPTETPVQLIIDLLWFAVRSHFVCVVTSQTGWSSSIVISL